jgi:hypothetical protein
MASRDADQNFARISSVALGHRRSFHAGNVLQENYPFRTLERVRATSIADYSFVS